MLKLNAVVIVAAIVVGAVALYVGGGWGIVILDAGAVVVLGALFIRNLNRGGDGDAAG
jgi:hypothetical protein